MALIMLCCVWAQSIRDFVVLHTDVARRLDAVLADRPRPLGDDRVLEVGPDPLRVLLAGAGLAVGYGVTARGQGLGGAVATALHAATGRGVIVDHRVQPNVAMRATVALLGGTGAHTYDLVIWCPTFTELPRTWRLGHWLTDLRRIMRQLVESGDPRTSYLLLGYPLIADAGRLEAVATAFVHRVNARISRVATEFPRTAFSYPPPAVNIGRALDADYYALCAAHLLPTVLHLTRLKLLRNLEKD